MIWPEYLQSNGTYLLVGKCTLKEWISTCGMIRLSGVLVLVFLDVDGSLYVLVVQVVEFLVGDGPNNRCALICAKCYSHNGMALPSEFEYCSKCLFMMSPF